MRNAILQVAIVVLSASYLLAASIQYQPTVIRMSESALLRNRTAWVAPIFPPIARAAHAGGPVIVDIEIDERGNVTSARVVSGHPLLQAAVLKAVREWRFRPIKVNHIPVRVTGRVTHVFREPKRAPPEETLVEVREQQANKNPNSFKTRYELGLAYLETTRFGDAVLQFSAAIRIKPDYAEAYLKLGHAYSHLRAHDKALVAFTEAARLNPNSSEAFHAMGLANIYLGKCEAALEPLRHSLEVEGPITTSHFLLGKCLLLLSRPDEAVISFKNGLAKYADSEMGHYGLGEVYLKLEQYTDAITEFKEAVRLSDGQGKSDSHYYLGLAYLRSGNREAAIKEYELLKKLNKELADQLLQEIRKPTTQGVGD